MAVSYQVETCNLLNQWRINMLENIWRFNQIAGPGVRSDSCPVYVQDDRESIAWALRQAYDMVVSELRYFPAPRWFEETIPLAGMGHYQLQNLRTRYTHLHRFGRRGVELIQANAVVVYSDSDGDGVDDTATITVATAIDESEVQLFFRVADGAPAAADERFQIEPLRVSAAGGNVTLTGHRALFVRPSTIWAIPFDPADPNFRERNAAATTNPANFVTTVDVYRIYNDPTDAVILNADPHTRYGLHCTGCETDTRSACARIVNGEQGFFQVREDCLRICSTWPESVTVSYYSGYPLQFGTMDRQLMLAVIRLANTYLPRKICAFCPATEDAYKSDWLAPGEGNDGIRNVIGPQDLNNPFGVLRGQVEAWRVTQRRKKTYAGAW